MQNRPVPDPQAMAALAVRSGPRTGEEIALRRSVRIGRGSQNDIVLDDDSVSTAHARLDHDAGNWRITDLNSTNGTFVEGVQLAAEIPTPLAFGAEVRLGAVELHFQPLDGPEPVEPEAEPARPSEKEAPLVRSGGFRLPVWVVLLIIVLIALAVFLYGWVLGPDPAPAASALAVVPLLSPGQAIP